MRRLAPASRLYHAAALKLLAATCLILYLAVTVPPASSSDAGRHLRLISPFAASISGAAADAREDIVVLANAYKSVAVWQLPDIQSLQTLRVPLRNEQPHRAHAVALSPDGTRVAYSVPPLLSDAAFPLLGSSRIYLIHRETGHIEQAIDAIATRVQAMRFSPDGKYLAAVLNGGCGLRVWTTNDGAEFYRDDLGYGGRDVNVDSCCREANLDRCDKRPSTAALVFSAMRGGLQLFTSGDTGVRRYVLREQRFDRTAFKTPASIGLGRPSGLALLDDSSMIVVSDALCRTGPSRADRSADEAERACLEPSARSRFPISVLIANDLALRNTIGIPDSVVARPGLLAPSKSAGAVQFNFNRIAVLNRGKAPSYLYAAGAFPCRAVSEKALLAKPEFVRENCIARWTLIDRGQRRQSSDTADGTSPAQLVHQTPEFIPAGTDRIASLAAMPKRDGVLVASFRSLRLMGTDGRSARSPTGATFAVHNLGADFRGGDLDFRISADAKTIVFEDYRSELSHPLRVRFELEGLQVNGGSGSDPALRPANQDDRVVRRWRNRIGTPPVFLDRELADDSISQTEVFRAVALQPRLKVALLGSDRALRIVDYGTVVPRTLCRLPVSQGAFRVNWTPDGRVAVVGHADGSLRWYRIVPSAEGSTPECRIDLLLTAHLSLVRNDDWRSWTYHVHRPSGIFATDPRATGQFEWVSTNRLGQVDVTPLTSLTDWYDRIGIETALDFVPRTSLARGSRTQRFEEALQERRIGARALRILLVPDNRQVYQPRVNFRIGIDRSRAGQNGQLQVRLIDGRGIVKFLDGRRFSPTETIALPSGEVFELGLELPEAARQQHGQTGICLYLNDVVQTCYVMEWRGENVTKIKRRLRAVLIGIAGYQVPRLALPFADNDVIDLAKLFTTDYLERVVRKPADGGAPSPGRAPPDFHEVQIDLVLSPLTAKLTDSVSPKLLKHLRQRAPTKRAVMQALREIVAESAINDFSDDLFLFYFSGHGFIHPGGPEIGRTALAMPGFLPNASFENIKRNALTSGELLRLIREIPGRKLIVIDACRTLGDGTQIEPFDPSLAHSEFTDSVLSADFLFASLPGQASVSTDELTFSPSRGPGSGNGVFSYAMLKSLTDPSALAFRRKAEKGLVYVDVPDIAASVRNFFLTSKYRGKQSPVFVPARRSIGRALVRSYLVEKQGQ